MPPINLLRKDSLKSPSHKGRLNEFTSVPRNFHNNYSSRVTSERETWFIKLSKRFVIRREFIVSLMAASDGCEHMWKVFWRFSSVNGHRRHSKHNFFVFPQSAEQFIESSACCANFASELEIDYCGFVLRSLFPLNHDFLHRSKASRTIIEWKRRNFFLIAIETDSIIWLVIAKMTGHWVLHEIQFQIGFLSRRASKNMYNLLMQDSLFQRPVTSACSLGENAHSIFIALTESARFAITTNKHNWARPFCLMIRKVHQFECRFLFLSNCANLIAINQPFTAN